ncbi:hypothetical protein DSUL_90012 [Desulfovibrionales bacterium]
MRLHRQDFSLSACHSYIPTYYFFSDPDFSHGQATFKRC